MLNQVPKHIAIIPDGNRRWAKAHGFLAMRGHEEGLKRFEKIINAAFDKGVTHMTLWVASVSNLEKRSGEEVSFLTNLMIKELERLYGSDDTVRKQTHVRVLGKGAEMRQNEKLDKAILDVEEKTKAFDNTFLTVLFGYDGQDEMLSAIQTMVDANIRPEGYAEVQSMLETGELPAVDLVIRTGGEPHWSAGFMMWQTANSQLYFTEKLWPEFDEAELGKAFVEYAKRGRRMGE